MNRSYCPVCNSQNTAIFLDIPGMPIYCNRLWFSREEALHAPKGELRLASCNSCGHIFNVAFDPDLMDYDQQYENSLHFSPRFQVYAEELARRLVQEYNLHDKDVIEIGCGKGDFLGLLNTMGQNRCIGFDPSYENNRTTHKIADNLQIIHDYFSENYDHYRADFICCRHVLEHIQNPTDFLKSVRRTIGQRSSTIVFFEVPNAMFTLRDMGIWDIIYEHCGYFTPSSLRHVFEACGFKVLKLQPGFEDQFLCIDAQPEDVEDIIGPSSGTEMNALHESITTFSQKYRAKVEHWEAELERIEASKQKAVLWGGGSKGVTFLNVLRNSQQIKYVVDINPHKQGRFVPGTGQEIVPAELLADYQPDIILVMNANYLAEIKESTDKLSLSPRFLVV